MTQVLGINKRHMMVVNTYFVYNRLNMLALIYGEVSGYDIRPAPVVLNFRKTDLFKVGSSKIHYKICGPKKWM